MRVLVIGGGWFVGRAVVDAAVSRGWTVTTFSRTGNGGGSVTAIRGNRTCPEDLSRLASSGPWDAVIDVPGVIPAHVRDSARALAGRFGQYVYVSTISVYRDWPAKPVAEDSPLRDGDPDEDPGQWRWGHGTYSRLKAGAEVALRRELGVDRLLVLRPGVVLGPGEYSGRLTWWLSRFHRGGRLLAPDPRDQPIQPVDVRDLAEFLSDSVARGAVGSYNVAAPPGHATFAGLLDMCRDATGSRAEVVWVSPDWLLDRGVRQWSEVPLWRTAPGTWQVDASRAFRAGLRCRPLAETVRDTWDWLVTGGQPVYDERRRLHGIDPHVEARLLSEWFTRLVVPDAER